MLTCFAMTLRSFLALALVAGLTGGLWSRYRPHRWLKGLLGGITGGLAVGVILAVGRLPLTAEIILEVAMMLASLAALIAPLLPMRRAGRILLGIAYAFPSLTAAAAMLRFGQFLADHPLSATTVLSSATIANTAGILLGLTTALLAGLVATHFAARSRSGLAWTALLLTALAFDLVVGAGAALGLMRLHWLEVTRGILSAVAKVTHATPIFDYVWAGILLLVIGGGLLAGGARTVKETAPAIGVEHRRIRAEHLARRRWMLTAWVTLVAVAGILLYQDLVLARPPLLSTPQLARMDAQDELRVATDQVQDGNLHRFAYLTDSGHMVRFFLINRVQDTGKPDIGVVFDACVLCGDQGYLQEGRDVICRACEGRIFVPTIGQEGGCNPIPLPHKKNADNMIVISRSALEAKGTVFTTNEKAATDDPVTGARLTTDQAVASWRYRHNTYYFASQSTCDQFKEAPDEYLTARAPASEPKGAR